MAGGGTEAVCLSTCNRTELYLAGLDDDEAEALRWSSCSRTSPVWTQACSTRRSTGCTARRRRCICSGWPPVSTRWFRGRRRSSVRSAGRVEAGAPGPVLDRLFRQALHAGKKARSETAIGESPASVSSAAAALAEQVFGDLSTSSVLLVGAGKVGELAARSLASRGAQIAFVASRRPERAASVAGEFRGRAVAFDRMGEVLPRSRRGRLVDQRTRPGAGPQATSSRRWAAGEAGRCS